MNRVQLQLNIEKVLVRIVVQFHIKLK